MLKHNIYSRYGNTPTEQPKQNGVQGTALHHWANTMNPKQCPVHELAKRIHHIKQHSNNPNKLLCAHWGLAGKQYINNMDIINAMRISIV